MDGIINVYKEKGWTSHDVVARMRGILRIRKIGHTGTLDPDAEGVLPVCIGRATRLSDMMADQSKTYRTVMLLGIVTDTQDVSGTVLETHVTDDVTQEQVLSAVRSFVGPYRQIPPMYSARKVNGRKLYELARAGKEVEREAKEVQILDICVEDMALPRVTMTVTCSKGTYIRTLCHDIGRQLGCGACMEHLVRIRTGRFRIEDSLKLDEVEALRDAGELETRVLSLDTVFEDLPSLTAVAGTAGDKLLHNGNPFLPEHVNAAFTAQENQNSAIRSEADVDGAAADRESRIPACAQEYERARVYDSEGRFIGIYGYDREKKRYQPQKIFGVPR